MDGDLTCVYAIERLRPIASEVMFVDIHTQLNEPIQMICKLSYVAMNDEYTKEGSRQKDDQSSRRNDDNEHQQQAARANQTNDADLDHAKVITPSPASPVEGVKWLPPLPLNRFVVE